MTVRPDNEEFLRCELKAALDRFGSKSEDGTRNGFDIEHTDYGIAQWYADVCAELELIEKGRSSHPRLQEWIEKNGGPER